MDFARRASGLLLSPLKVMEKVGDAVAEYLVPDSAGPAAAASKLAESQSVPQPAPPAQTNIPAAPAPLQAKRSTSVNAKKVSPAPKKVSPAPKKSITKKSSKRSPPIKKEPLRDLPFRSGRVKAGFYNESNLVALAWKGTGTSADPIQLEL